MSLVGLLSPNYLSSARPFVASWHTSKPAWNPTTAIDLTVWQICSRHTNPGLYEWRISASRRQTIQHFVIAEQPVAILFKNFKKNVLNHRTRKHNNNNNNINISYPGSWSSSEDPLVTGTKAWSISQEEYKHTTNTECKNYYSRTTNYQAACN